MEYKNGELLYVYKKNNNHFENGVFVLYRETYEGNEDLSYHGSSWYETFIEAEDLETGEIKTFGSQKYHWCNAKIHIKYLEDKINAIKKIL